MNGPAARTRPRAFFGRPWGTCTDAVRVNPPIGCRCVQCAEVIGPHDRGHMTIGVRVHGDALAAVRAPVHMECALRCAVGSITHLIGAPPPGVGASYRQEAQWVLAEINRLRHKQNLGPL